MLRHEPGAHLGEGGVVLEKDGVEHRAGLRFNRTRFPRWTAEMLALQNSRMTRRILERTLQKSRELDWNDLRYLLLIARGGNLSAAARRAGVNQTTVARRLAVAEEALGARLFDRIEGS